MTTRPRSAAADRLSLADSSDTEWHKEYEAWIAKNGVRARRLTDAERAEFNKEYLKVSAEWVKRWPDSPNAWDTYTMMLADSPDSSKEEVEHAGEQVLRLARTRGG